MRPLGPPGAQSTFQKSTVNPCEVAPQSLFAITCQGHLTLDAHREESSGVRVMPFTAVSVKYEQDSRTLSKLLSIDKMAAYRAICAFSYTGNSQTIWGLIVTWQSKHGKTKPIGPVRRHCDFKMMSKEKRASRSHTSCH